MEKIELSNSEVLTFVSVTGCKHIIPINDSLGKIMTKSKDNIIHIVTNREDHKYVETKKVEIKKYKDAIGWINEK